MTDPNELDQLDRKVAELQKFDIDVDEDGTVWYIVSRGCTCVPTAVSPTATPEPGTTGIQYSPARNDQQAMGLVREFKASISYEGGEDDCSWYVTFHGPSSPFAFGESPNVAIVKAVIALLENKNGSEA